MMGFNENAGGVGRDNGVADTFIKAIRCTELEGSCSEGIWLC